MGMFKAVNLVSSFFILTLSCAPISMDATSKPVKAAVLNQEKSLAAKYKLIKSAFTGFKSEFYTAEEIQEIVVNLYLVAAKARPAYLFDLPGSFEAYGEDGPQTKAEKAEAKRLEKERRYFWDKTKAVALKLHLKVAVANRLIWHPSNKVDLKKLSNHKDKGIYLAKILGYLYSGPDWGYTGKKRYHVDFTAAIDGKTVSFVGFIVPEHALTAKMKKDIELMRKRFDKALKQVNKKAKVKATIRTSM